MLNASKIELVGSEFINAEALNIQSRTNRWLMEHSQELYDATLAFRVNKRNNALDIIRVPNMFRHLEHVQHRSDFARYATDADAIHTEKWIAPKNVSVALEAKISDTALNFLCAQYHIGVCRYAFNISVPFYVA